MKNFKLLLLALAFIGFGLSINSCKNTGDSTTETESNKQGLEYTSEYVCPMHCEGSGSDQPGDCPVCGMAYIKNDQAQGINHDGHDHRGHQH